MRIKFIQKLIDKIRGKKAFLNIQDNYTNYDYDNIQYKSIIATKGFFYSGSSTVVGFMEEFDNTFVYGNRDNVYSAKQKSFFNCGNEVAFFHYSGFWELLDAFSSKKICILEKDIAIKKFIRSIYNAKDRKMLSDWDYCSNFYNSAFYEISMKYLYEILDFSEYDLGVLENERIPYVFEKRNNDTYKNCSFMYGKNSTQHPLYKFKNITQDEFDTYTSKFLHRLFNIVKSKEIIVYDQLIEIDGLEKINKYMNDINVKLICVYRDPRDHFFSLFKNDSRGVVPRSPEKFIEWYKAKMNNDVFKPQPNKLVISFEDFVLNYDETSQKIMDFCGLKKENHVAPKSIFDPEISKVNIGAWKDFYDKDFMKQIGEALKEYCYEPDNM